MKVTTIVLPEVPASSLLSDPATACFAAGSDAEARIEATNGVGSKVRSGVGSRVRSGGRIEAERATLRRVLALRKLGLKADGEARIEACTDLATLQRWLDQAVLAASADEALQ